MTIGNRVFDVIVLLLMFSALSAFSGEATLADKKLIHGGWDVPPAVFADAVDFGPKHWFIWDPEIYNVSAFKPVWLAVEK